jgi:hypothetical protein
MDQITVGRALDKLFLTNVCSATELLLVRHAMADAGLAAADPSLTAAGRFQAAMLADALWKWVSAASRRFDGGRPGNRRPCRRRELSAQVVPALAPVQMVRPRRATMGRS